MNNATLGRHGSAPDDDVRLTYVAITRATHEAFLTYSRRSALVERMLGRADDVLHGAGIPRLSRLLTLPP